MAKPYPKEFVEKIGKEVLNGKSKFRVTKEMKLLESNVKGFLNWD